MNIVGQIKDLIREAEGQEIIESSIKDLESIKHRILVFSVLNFVSALFEIYYDVFGGINTETKIDTCEEIDSPEGVFELILNIF